MALGLVDKSECWTLLRALYGLRRSPRLWGVHRDENLKQVTIKYQGKTHHLKQNGVDSCLWQIKLEEEGHPPRICGLICTYVDDFLLVGEAFLLDLVAAEILKIWKASPPKKLVREQTLEFCGLQLEYSETEENALLIHQRGYIAKFLQRHGLETCNGAACINLDHPSEEDSAPTPEDLRTLQEYAGEVNWLSNRTCSFINYAVSVPSSALSRLSLFSFR